MKNKKKIELTKFRSDVSLFVFPNKCLINTKFMGISTAYYWHQARMEDVAVCVLELDSSEGVEFGFVNNDNMMSTKEEQRKNEKIVPPPFSSRERRWTVYDMSSADFISVPKLEESGNEDLRSIGNRCAPIKMTLKVSNIFKYGLVRTGDLFWGSHIEYKDRNGTQFSLPFPNTATSDSVLEIKGFCDSLAIALEDPFFKKIIANIHDSCSYTTTGREFMYSLVQEVKKKAKKKKSLCIRLLCACSRTMNQPMLDSLKNESKIIKTQYVRRTVSSEGVGNRSAISKSPKTHSGPRRMSIDLKEITEIEQPKLIIEEKSSGGPKSPRDRRTATSVAAAMFHGGKKKVKSKLIELNPEQQSYHVQISRSSDNTFLVRHRQSERAVSEMFPCPSFGIEWQSEYILDESVTSILAMYPKIVSLSVTAPEGGKGARPGAIEKIEKKILSELESRLFS